MFYFTFIFLFASIFLLIKDKESISTKYLIYIMASYTIALFSMMFYLSKDTYYYNTVYNYFSLPSSMWKIMMFSNIKRDYLIIAMNLASLSVLYFGICFALSFQILENPKPIRITQSVVAALLFAEFLFYLPGVTRAVYLKLYPKQLTYARFLELSQSIHTITSLLNACIVLISIIILLFSYYKASPLRMIRLNIFAVGFCYTLVMISYLFIFGSFPRILIKVSKIAGAVTYLSIPLNQSEGIHRFFPYYLIFTFLLIGYSLYCFSNVNNKIAQQTFSLSKQIAASDTTSKVFCHYMKNELLAIRSEVEMLRLSGEDGISQQNVMKRCDNLYERLDSIHKSTKSSELYLTEVNLYRYIEEILSHLSHELKGFHVELKTEIPSLAAMLDANYFEQALHNILTNAFDAMDGLPPERKNLVISIQSMNNWAVILIKDSGIGISKENLGKIFDPFYSSAPVAKHWGMGLSLTHKIIAAHEGYIEAESQEGIGTTIKIMLPRLICLKN